MNLLKRAHFILMDSVRGRDQRRGEFRREQNWIGPPGTPLESAMITQAEEDGGKARRILDLYDRMKARVAELTRSQFAIRTLDVLFDHPILSTPQFVARSGLPKGSAVRILGTLANGGILRVIRPGLKRRPAIYAFPELIEIVDAAPIEAPAKVEPTVRTLDVVSHQ